PPISSEKFPKLSDFRALLTPLGGVSLHRRTKNRSKSPKISRFGHVLARFGTVFHPCQEDKTSFSAQKSTPNPACPCCPYCPNRRNLLIP
ncbi:MAG: hypothetical protein ACYTEX_06285, partial [Planctomycetota bacterium]